MERITALKNKLETVQLKIDRMEFKPDEEYSEKLRELIILKRNKRNNFN